MLERIEYLILDGHVVQQTCGVSSITPEQAKAERDNLVRATVENGQVSLRWHTRGRNWASLYFASEWMASFAGPYKLEFHASGWFEEQYASLGDARDRIEALLCKSDVHLSSSVYIHNGDRGGSGIPEILKRALETNEAPEEGSIDCIFDPNSGRYKVQRVGEDSTIGKYYGLSPISFPCLTGHTYDQVVSRAYPEVMRTGEPLYDHIYAAMAGPVGEVLWVPYQRVVLPLRQGRTRKGVRVITECGQVDISPL